MLGALVIWRYLIYVFDQTNPLQQPRITHPPTTPGRDNDDDSVYMFYIHVYS